MRPGGYRRVHQRQKHSKHARPCLWRGGGGDGLLALVLTSAISSCCRTRTTDDGSHTDADRERWSAKGAKNNNI